MTYLRRHGDANILACAPQSDAGVMAHTADVSPVAAAAAAADAAADSIPPAVADASPAIARSSSFAAAVLCGRCLQLWWLQ